ncbi:EamA family transporter [Halobium palmae]|uniref:EamA family transporter n=1 Tax=Halobium palmae TaxID=1776492 RepID=A0ABD5RV27_9EURY
MIPGSVAPLSVGLALAAALLLAVQALCIRVGTDDGSTAEALAVVLLVNVAVYVPAALLRYGLSPDVSLLSFGAFALAGLVGAVVGRAAYYGAIEHLGASRAEPLKASQPFHASLIAVFVLGETLSASTFVGIALIVGGVAVITAETSRGGGSRGRRNLGLGLGVGAAFAYGVEPTVATVGLDTGTPLLVGLAVKMTVAAGVVLAYFTRRGSVTAGLTAQGRRWYVAAGLANTLFQLAYYGALSTGTVVVVVPIVQTSPLFVAALSVVALPRLERVTWQLAAASAVVVLGAIWVTLAG